MFVAEAAPRANPTPLPAGLLPGLLNPRRLANAASPRPSTPAYLSSAIASREVPDWVRWIWRGAMALLIALGPVLIAAAEAHDHGARDPGFAAQRAFGAGAIGLGVLCFLQSFPKRINGWWSYLLKPLVLFACLQTILISAFELGFSGPGNDAEPLGIFFIIFPAITFLTLLFVKARPPRPQFIRPSAPQAQNAPPPLPQENSPAPISTFEAAARAANASYSSIQLPLTRHPHPRPQKLRILANFIGWSLHTMTFFLAIAVVLDLPHFVAAGLLDQRLADDMNRSLGNNWAKLAHMQGYILVYIGAFLATMFLMLGRRSQGILHMLRPIFAAACFLIAMVMLDQSLRGQWKPIQTPPAPIRDGRPGNPRVAQASDAIVQYLDAAQAKLSIISLFLALTGLALLLWPAPQPRAQPNIDREEGAS